MFSSPGDKWEAWRRGALIGHEAGYWFSLGVQATDVEPRGKNVKLEDVDENRQKQLLRQQGFPLSNQRRREPWKTSAGL